MLVQGPTSILISNYHYLIKKYYNFLSPFFNIFQRKINTFEDFNHHQMVVFWPPFSAISTYQYYIHSTVLRILCGPYLRFVVKKVTWVSSYCKIVCICTSKNICTSIPIISSSHLGIFFWGQKCFNGQRFLRG